MAANEEDNVMSDQRLEDLIRRGEDLFSAGNIEDAAQHFRQLLDVYPRQAMVRNNLGVAFWQLGRPGDALEQLAAAIELDRDYREAYLNVFKILLALDKTEDATRLLAAYLQAHPDDVDIRRMLDERNGERPVNGRTPERREWVAKSKAPSATPRSRRREQRIRVAVFAAEPKEWASVQLRLLGPLGLASDDIEVIWASKRVGDSYRYATGAIDQCDLVVTQRMFPSAGTRGLCAKILESGKPVIYDIDDNPLDVPETHPRRHIIEEATPYILEFLNRSDKVTVATSELAERLVGYNDCIEVLPNSLDATLWAGSQSSRGKDSSERPITIGYSGTPTHFQDLALIEKVLWRIREKFGKRVVFRFFGCMPHLFEKLSGVERHPFELDYNRYAAALQNSGIDIAIAPLQNNDFNRCKSDIKWLEYSACGFAGVYSNVPAYSGSVEHGETGFLVDDSEDAWFGALNRLIEDAPLRERLGTQAQGRVFETRTSQALQECYLAVYRDAKADGRRDRTSGMPVSAEYEIWKKKHENTERDLALWARRGEEAAAGSRVEVIVYTGEGQEKDLAETLNSLERQVQRKFSVVLCGPAKSAKDKWNLSMRCVDADGGRLAGVNGAIRESGASFVGFVEAGDRLAPEAIAACLAYLGLNSEWRAVYSDEDFLAANGHRGAPLFKPDLNWDLLLATPYVGNFCLVRRKAVCAAGGLQALGASGTADLILRIVERNGPQAVGHVPLILYHRTITNALGAKGDIELYPELVRAHVSRRGLGAKITEGPIAETLSVRYPGNSSPLVTIIVPTRDCLDSLEACIASLLNKTAYPNWELIIVDNGSKERETLEFLAAKEAGDERVRVVPYPKDFNFAAINNEAARQARGEYLLLLNNDTVVLDKDWLSIMMEHAQRPDVGIVGTRLLFPDGTVQHAGVIVGMGRAADHVGYGQQADAPGYMCRAQLSQEVSAVTGACLLIRKACYFESGGLDEEKFRVLFNDVDLCLKVRQAGYRVVWTPQVTLAHHESRSLGGGSNSKKKKHAEAEVESMWEKWMPELANDPAYNRNLSLSSRYWNIETEIDVTWDPNFKDVHQVLGLGGGSEGVLQHRMRIPLNAMREAGVIQCSVVPAYSDRIRMPTPVELARVRPDAVLAHNAVHDEHLEALQAYRRFTDAFLVFGQDDLMLDLPRTNPFYTTVFKDIKRRLRVAMSTCHRLVVTTEPLADAYRAYADDIVVVPNYLPRAIWGNLRSRRRRGCKPRVGWAGAQQHAGDLQILRQVIKATAHEVDWVFFGMSLREFRRYRKELHDAVAFEEYPQALARLDLDLAVAPLERNRFNEAKSNLRILEYGALGWPVVGSDIEPYRNAPVCRVANKATAWIEAIRERVHDLDAAEREGDALRKWVLENWMLEDNLELWLTALSSTDREMAWA